MLVYTTGVMHSFLWSLPLTALVLAYRISYVVAVSSGCSTSSAITAAMPATVTYNAGVVIGTHTSLPGATATVNKFLGVPFAMSPPERLSPPQAAGPFANPIMAKEWKPACVQQFVCP